MPKLVVLGATLQCSMGAAPSSFAISPSHKVTGDDVDAGNVNDFVPNTNIASFGMCQSMSNPQVSAATSAAQGVLTPQPCVPVISDAWSPGSRSVTVADQPALHDGCTCACQWDGTISVTSAGQEDVEVD